LINREKLDFPTWDDGNTASKDVRSGELALERLVSRVIGRRRLVRRCRAARVTDRAVADALKLPYADVDHSLQI